jgi:D-tyrosyl-tRNA(Tyr) deacylase
MRAFVQRVTRASSEPGGKIGQGLFILFGVGQEDNQGKADRLAKKIAKLRVMADEKGKMNLSLKDTDTSCLVVSQFTLYADTTKGNRPSFIKAAQPKRARKLYEYFVEKLKQEGIKVETGNFGDYMKISTTLDGPVTILLEE